MIILLLSSGGVRGQLVNNGQNPPSLKWKELETGHFSILFPAEMGPEAQRTANLLEHLWKEETGSFGRLEVKTPIILQNQTVVPNGFVTLAPRRAEFYTTPPQDAEPTDWIGKLAAHELRHIAQINHTIATKKIRAPLLQEIQFAFFGASMPVWLVEGDAVVTETALTRGGRGEMPGWEREFRANVLSGKDYSYSKYFFGSLKDNIPDYYRMGYFMTSRLRRTCGDSLFTEILNTSIRRSPIPGAFSHALNKYTGTGSSGLFRATVRDLRDHWARQLEQLDPERYPALNRRRNTVKTDYLLPHRLDPGGLICLKRGLGDAPAFVVIDSAGKESRLLRIGPQLSPHFDYAAGKLVWDELKYDPRFQYRDYSVINLYDIKTRRFRQLTRRSRLFAPSLSADGEKIVAVKVDAGNLGSLVVLDAGTGSLLWESKKFREQLQTPAFDGEGRKVVFMLSGVEGRSMGLYDTRENTFRIIREADDLQSGYPVFAGEGTVIFQSHLNGIENIYALEIATGRTRQLTSAFFGALHPAYLEKENRILFNDAVVEGMNITGIDLELPPEEAGTLPGENTFESYAVFPARKRNLLETAPSRTYPVKDYKGPGRLFNFHSISPTGAIDDDNYILGLRLKSNNLLNTLAFTTGYNYNLSLRSGEYTAALEYRKFYPVLSLDYINRKREIDLLDKRLPRTVDWRENELELALKIPLSFTKRNQLYAIELSGGTTYTSRYAIEGAPAGFIREISFPLTTRFSFVRQSLRSARDLAPRFGQQFSLQHRSLALDDRLEGSFFAARSLFFFPGFFRHHSFSAGYNYQHGEGQYRGLVEIPEISGSGSLTRTVPLESTLLLDYRFPIAYPDFELGTFAYIKRIKGGFFADYENIGKAGARLGRPDSYGFELRMDANFLRLYMPEFDIGTKVVFFSDRQVKSPAFELVLNYNLAL